MARIEFKFDMAKAVEVILYIANRVDEPTFMGVAKLMYFADKTSLETFGRFLCGDTYVAMQHGPVPSDTYDLMKAGRDGEKYGFSVTGYHIHPLREANTDLLSDSDIACLDMVIEAFGKLPLWMIRQISHDAAYEATWKAAGKQGNKPIPIEEVASLFDSEKELVEHLTTLNDD